MLALSVAGSPGADADAPGEKPPVATPLSDVLVTAPAENQTYAATNATTALKADIPLLETSQAVSVIPQALLRDQGVRKVEDALRNVAGVSIGGYYSDWDYYRIRGFDAAFTTYWDGLRGDYGMGAEVFGLERVEVVKGPGSSLYGQGPVGGMVNLVSKRPIPETFADVQMTYGSFEFYEPAVDMGAPLNDDKTVYFRLNALYRDQESFVDYVEKQRVFVAPALTWELGPDTRLTLLASYVHDWNRMGMPLPARGTVLPNVNGKIPHHRFIGEPDADKAEQWRARGGYDFQHRFNEVLSLQQNLSYSRMSQHWPDLLYPASLDADERTLYRYPYNYRENLDRFGVDTSLTGEFDTGSVEHRLTGGVDFYRTRSSSDTQQIDYNDFPGSYPALDLFDPVYGGPMPSYASSSHDVSEAELVGIYIQDHAKFFERFALTLGGRIDWSSSGSDSAEGFTPRVGAAYELVRGAAVYASYSQSFNPQWNYRDASGSVVDPETGENFELGLKTDLLDGRFSSLLAIYQLTRKDVAAPNSATPDPFDSANGGEQRSRGVELEGTFRPVAGLELSSAYSYTDAEITKHPVDELEGRALAGVPEHMFNVWVRYTLQSGPLRGLGFGIGGRYYTEQEGDATYTPGSSFELPGYGVMDVAAYYRRGRFYSQLNVNNVLDERYFAGSYSDLYVLPGEPVTAKATIGWTF